MVCSLFRKQGQWVGDHWGEMGMVYLVWADHWGEMGMVYLVWADHWREMGMVYLVWADHWGEMGMVYFVSNDTINYFDIVSLYESTLGIRRNCSVITEMPCPLHPQTFLSHYLIKHKSMEDLFLFLVLLIIIRV